MADWKNTIRFFGGVPHLGVFNFQQAGYKPHVVLDFNGNSNIENQINSLADLPDGWDYGQGGSPTPATVESAISLSRTARLSLGSSAVEAMPETDGSISLIFQTEDEGFVDLTIKSNSTYDLRFERGIGADYEVESEVVGINYFKVVWSLVRHSNRVDNTTRCISYEPSTLGNTLKGSDDLDANPSIPIKGTGPLSTLNVLRMPARETFVPTFMSTTAQVQ